MLKLYDPVIDAKGMPQVYDNPKSPGTVVIRLSHYKCLVTSPKQAQLIANALQTYFKEKA